MEGVGNETARPGGEVPGEHLPAADPRWRADLVVPGRRRLCRAGAFWDMGVPVGGTLYTTPDAGSPPKHPFVLRVTVTGLGYPGNSILNLSARNVG